MRFELSGERAGSLLTIWKRINPTIWMACSLVIPLTRSSALSVTCPLPGSGWKTLCKIASWRSMFLSFFRNVFNRLNLIWSSTTWRRARISRARSFRLRKGTRMETRRSRTHQSVNPTLEPTPHWLWSICWTVWAGPRRLVVWMCDVLGTGRREFRAATTVSRKRWTECPAGCCQGRSGCACA